MQLKNQFIFLPFEFDASNSGPKNDEYIYF